MDLFDHESFPDGHETPNPKAEKMKLNVTCVDCGTQHEIEVRDEDWEAWQSGVLIQRAMPYLSAEQRELLISQTCEKCFNEMFGGDGG